MPTYKIVTKDKGLTSSQITEVENLVDSSYAIATPNPHLGFIHVTPLGNYSAKDLPALPYGLTYEENPGT